MPKLKPKITSGSINIEFDRDVFNPESKNLAGISVGIELTLENVPIEGLPKYQIAQDLRDALEIVKKKYE